MAQRHLTHVASTDTSTDNPVPRYLVALATPGGLAEIEVPTFLGPAAAGRRAFWSACACGWGDVEDITVTAVRLLGPEE